MRTSENQKTQRPLPTAKQHLALCQAVIDLGTQTSQYGPARRICVSWEIPGETAVFEKEKGLQPFVVTAEYTLSLDVKANFRKMLDSWFGRPITEMLKDNDGILDSNVMKKFLSRPGMIQITHNKSDKDGLIYANIAAKGVSVFKRPADVPFPKATVNPAFLLDLDDFSAEDYAMVPKWIKQKIEKAPEFLVVNAGGATTSGALSSGDEFNDDDPF